MKDRRSSTDMQKKTGLASVVSGSFFCTMDSHVLRQNFHKQNEGKKIDGKKINSGGLA